MAEFNFAEDLQKSGLTESDIRARVAGGTEFAAAKLPGNSKGYIIPYYDINGTRIPFYRVKLFENAIKYAQPSGTANHIYFPIGFMDCFNKCVKANGLPSYVLLTEGEKKAAAAVKAGIPAVAVGGVDSWRNRTLILPPDTKLDNAGSKVVKAKLPASAEIKEDFTIAVGLRDLIDLLTRKGAHLIICYDTDLPEGMKLEVQRAAAMLAYELYHMGLSKDQIKQMVLGWGKGDPTKPDSKVALDDFIVHNGADELKELIKYTLTNRYAFPRHPNPKAYLNKELSQGKLNRKEVQLVALSILAELDARGRRMRSSNETMPYYFDEPSKELIPAQLLGKNGIPLHESAFGVFLYKQFGLTAGDSRILQQLASQFTGEDPVSEVDPKRLLCILPVDKDKIALQISDSEFVIISGDEDKPVEICSNGMHGVLFEQGHTSAVDAKELLAQVEEQLKEPLICRWQDIFDRYVNLKRKTPEYVLFAALLFYISPWLLRWRGTQLPIELAIGEAGSGKSSLYELRLSILTGDPKLRNIPTDLKDWYSSIINSGGLHTTDNVQFTNKELKQRMSDEICRIITEPNPHIEMRKLYTTSGQAQAPITSVFAMTAIQQPFHNSDIVQRAAILELSAVGSGHEGDWVKQRLSQYGGRVNWLAHQIIVIHKFLNIATREGKWDSSYKADHRLANYEQVLKIMCEVFSMPSDWVPKLLSSNLQVQLADADWTLEGLKSYVDYVHINHPGGTQFTAADISNWALVNDEYENNSQMCNSRALGRYIISHSSTVLKVTGIEYCGTKNNRKMFKVGPKKT